MMKRLTLLLAFALSASTVLATVFTESGPQPKGEQGPAGPAGAQGDPGPAGSGTTNIGFHATPGASQSVANNSLTTLHFTTEEYDNGGNWDGTNFVPAVDGLYLVYGHISLGTGTLTDGRFTSPQVYVNGGQDKRVNLRIRNAFGAGVEGPHSFPVYVLDLTTSDTVTFRVQHDFGPTMTRNTDGTINYIGAQLLQED